MPIDVRCPNCAKDFRLKDELAGRTVRCKCGQAFIVPQPETEEPADSLLELLDDADREAANQLASQSASVGTIVELIGTVTNQELELALAQRLCAQAEQDIVRVFGARAQNCRLKVVGEVFNQDLSGAHLKYKIAGQLNGRAVKKTINRAAKSAMAMGVQAGIGGALGAAVVMGASAALRGRAQQSTTAQFDQCFQLCLADLRMFIEEQGPRSATSHVDRFRLAKYIGIGLGVVSVFVSAVAMHAQADAGKFDWAAAFILGALAGGMFGMAAYGVAIGIMPTGDFVNTPRGRWLTRSDPSRVTTVRMGFMAMGAMSALWAVGLTALPTIGKYYRENLPQAPAQQPMPRFGRP